MSLVPTSHDVRTPGSYSQMQRLTTYACMTLESTAYCKNGISTDTRFGCRRECVYIRILYLRAPLHPQPLLFAVAEAHIGHCFLLRTSTTTNMPAACSILDLVPIGTMAGVEEWVAHPPFIPFWARRPERGLRNGAQGEPRFSLLSYCTDASCGSKVHVLPVEIRHAPRKT